MSRFLHNTEGFRAAQSMLDRVDTYMNSAEDITDSLKVHKWLVEVLEELQKARRLLRWSYCLLYEIPVATEGLSADECGECLPSREFLIAEQGSLESVTESLQENLEALSTAQLYQEFESNNELFELSLSSMSLIRRVSYMVTQFLNHNS